MSNSAFRVATPFDKRYKLFISGPPGCFKTRVGLRLANNNDRQEPALAVIDTEFGTDHYRGEFAFRILDECDPDIIQEKTTEFLENPGKVTTLMMDTFSVYYAALMAKYADLYLMREKTSPGHKGEYYIFQPRDYAPINRDANKLVREFLACDLNIICICQIKDKWEGMKVIGSVFDGWKGLPYYFDTIIEVTENKKKSGTWTAKVTAKDRSNTFKLGEEIPWGPTDEESDASKAIADYLVKKFGRDFTIAGEAKAEAKPKSESSSDAQSDKKKKEAEPPIETTQAGEDDPDKFDKSGKVPHDKLTEVVTLKKKLRINDKEVWNKLVSRYPRINHDTGAISDEPLQTATDMSTNQATELIKDLVRIEADPNYLNSLISGS